MLLIWRNIINTQWRLHLYIHRSPSSTETEFLGVFEEIFEEMCELNCDIIAGDFNIDWCYMDDNGIKQVIGELT